MTIKKLLASLLFAPAFAMASPIVDELEIGARASSAEIAKLASADPRAVSIFCGRVMFTSSLLAYAQEQEQIAHEHLAASRLFVQWVKDDAAFDAGTSLYEKSTLSMRDQYTICIQSYSELASNLPADLIEDNRVQSIELGKQVFADKPGIIADLKKAGLLPD